MLFETQVSGCLSVEGSAQFNEFSPWTRHCCTDRHDKLSQNQKSIQSNALLYINGMNRTENSTTARFHLLLLAKLVLTHPLPFIERRDASSPPCRPPLPPCNARPISLESTTIWSFSARSTTLDVRFADALYSPYNRCWLDILILFGWGGWSGCRVGRGGRRHCASMASAPLTSRRIPRMVLAYAYTLCA